MPHEHEPSKQSYTAAGSQNVTVNDGSHISLGLKQFWAVVVSVFALACWVTAFQLKTTYAIERLHSDNQIAHAQIMVKLASLDLYVLKQNMVETLCYISRQRDIQLQSITTNVLVADEFRFKEDIRKLLQ